MQCWCFVKVIKEKQGRAFRFLCSLLYWFVFLLVFFKYYGVCLWQVFKPSWKKTNTSLFFTSYFNSLVGLFCTVCTVTSYGNFSLVPVLLSIRCLLEDPNPDDPLVPELASLLKKNSTEYYRQVRQATLQYAVLQ